MTTLRLDQDVPEILAFLRDTCANYVKKHKHAEAGPHHGPVSAIALLFQIGEESSIELCLDTRPRFEWDRTWTHEAFGTLPRPRWEKAFEAIDDDGLEIIGIDGKTLRVTPDTDDELTVSLFGQMLVAAIQQAETAKTFETLPRNPKCVTLVEDIEGFFAWPESL